MEIDKVIEQLQQFDEISIETIPNSDINIVNIDAGTVRVNKIRQMLNSFCARTTGSVEDAKNAGDLVYTLICNQLHILPVHLVSAETMNEKKGVSWKIVRERGYDREQLAVEFGNDPETGERAIYICPKYLKADERQHTSGEGGKLGMGFITVHTELVKYLLSYNLLRQFVQSLLNNNKFDESKLTPEQKEVFEKIDNAITDDLALELVKSLGDEQLLKEANEYFEKYGNKNWQDLGEDIWLIWKKNKTDVTKYPKFNATKEELIVSLSA